MAALSFPDVNVWMAVLLAEHIHHERVKSWWNEEPDAICFIRITQLSVLRLLTTTSVMNGKPLTMKAAWKAYDRLFVDERVNFMPEGRGVEESFRNCASVDKASPKVWADSWLLAMAEIHDGTVITLDTSLATRSRGTRTNRCVLLN